MSEENKVIFVKRFKSFVWRLGSVIAVAALSFAGEQLDLVTLPVQAEVIIGLVIAEFTKALNTKK